MPDYYDNLDDLLDYLEIYEDDELLDFDEAEYEAGGQYENS